MAINLNAEVAASLTRYNMLKPGDRVGVAVSGGADSVTLLHVLHQSAAYDIVVLHVNHQLRGSESDGDENFVCGLARTLGLPVEVRQAPIGSGNMEQLARDARRMFFAEARETFYLQKVALGHNQSDQAETVLYRFLRGSGLAGLAGMSAVTADGLIRPLLLFTREEIRTWARDHDLTWREDSSNENTELARNRLRLEMLNPRLVQILSANAAVARDEEEWWAGRISELYKALLRATPLGLQLPVDNLACLHPAEQRRVIRHAIQQLKGDLRSIDLSHVEGIRKLLQSQAGHDRILVPGIDALRSFSTLLLAKPGRIGTDPRHYRVPVEIGRELALPHASGRLYVNWIKPENQFCGNFGVEADSIQEVTELDGESLAQSGDLVGLSVRNWEPGDKYLRFGHEKPEKIKDWFQEYRVLLWDRRRWPVMVLNDEIVWSRQFGVAAKFTPHAGSASILRMVYVSDDAPAAEMNRKAGNYVT